MAKCRLFCAQPCRYCSRLALRKDEPANRQSLFLLADCYLRLGQNEGVVALLEPVYQQDPNDQAVQYALGTASIRTGNLSPGEHVIDRILMNGHTAEANLLRGEAQFAVGDYKAALGPLRKAVDLNPHLPGAWSLCLGVLLVEGHDNAAAEAAFRRA